MEAVGRKWEVCTLCICGEMGQFILVSLNGSNSKERWTVYWSSTNEKGWDRSVFFFSIGGLSLWCFLVVVIML